MNLCQLLDDLAARWADARYVKANAVLRTRITDLAADHKSLKRQFRRIANANESLSVINRAYQAINGRVEAERDIAQARVVELEEALVAASGKPGMSDDGWDGVVAAGLGTPEASQP